MIIETHTSIDSRFVLYDLVNILSRYGTIKWITANDKVINFDYENNIEVEHVEPSYFEEVDNNTEDYVIYDNLIAAVPDMTIHFIDPYTELNHNLIGKNDYIIKIMQGIGVKRKKQDKNKAELDDRDLFLEDLKNRPHIKKIQSYENIYRYETLKCDLSTSTEFIKALITIKLIKPASKNQGGHREHSNEKLYPVLW